MRLGLHVSIADGLSRAVERAEALGCNAMQIFSRSPRGWGARPIDASEAARFRDARKAADIFPLAVHASYLINLASNQPALYERSIAALVEELERAKVLGAEYLVVHVGSSSGEEGRAPVRRVIAALRRVLKRGRRSTGLLLENTAGERGDIGWRLEELAEILDGLPDDSAGVCLDTCHLFAAGYDISNAEGVEAVAGKVRSGIGRERVKLIHGNDSKKGLNCRVDRHQHIGQGGIGRKGFRAWLNHPVFRDIPMVLETPKEEVRDDLDNLSLVRRLRGTTSSTPRRIKKKADGKRRST